MGHPKPSDALRVKLMKVSVSIMREMTLRLGKQPLTKMEVLMSEAIMLHSVIALLDKDDNKEKEVHYCERFSRN
jgi:hypothetical protein